MPHIYRSRHCASNQEANAKRGEWWLPTPKSDAQVAMACPVCGTTAVLRHAGNWKKITPEGGVPGGFICPRVSCMTHISGLSLMDWGKAPMLPEIDTTINRGDGRPMSRRTSF
jgi:hypothetical protein